MMKNLIKKLFACGLMLGTAVPLLADEDCPCAGGTEPYTVDCDGDGTMDACSTDECPSCTVQNPDPSTPGYECCGSEEFDPDAGWGGSFSQSLNFSQIIDAANDSLDTLPISGGCSFDSPSVTGSISGQEKEECCDDELTDLKKFTGTISVSSGATCDIPVPFASIPNVADTFLVLNASVAGNVNASSQQSCDQTNVCFGVNLAVGGGLGGALEILSGIVRAEANIGLNGGVAAEYCTEDSQFSGVNVCFSSLVGEVKTSAVWGLWQNSYDYVWDDFNNC